MKLFVYLFSAIMFIANIIQASPEIGTIDKVKEQYVLINTGNDLGDKGDKLNVYRLEGFDYRRIGRIELIKVLEMDDVGFFKGAIDWATPTQEKKESPNSAKPKGN